MAATTTSTTFDTAALTAAIEHRDAEALLALYAPDAEVVTIDETARPSSPRVLRGHEELRPQFEDICARDMTHEVTTLASGDRLAYQVRCRYADGTRVLCHAMATLRGGRIAREEVVQAWDA